VHALNLRLTFGLCYYQKRMRKNRFLKPLFLLLILAVVSFGAIFGLGIESKRPFYEVYVNLKCKFVRNGKVVQVHYPPETINRCMEMYKDGGTRCFDDKECEGKCVFTCDKAGKEGVCEYYHGWLPGDYRYWDKTINSCVVF